jgi:signal transduction histidine kinase
MAQIARDVLNDLESIIKEADVQVEVGVLPSVKADPDQMRHLLRNLISNAIKYSRPGERSFVRISGWTSGGFDRFVVEDNGIGFDEKFLDRMFKPFQRLHGRGSEYEGTGMGLAICRKIAEIYGGKISARSTPGKGSTFIVELPVTQRSVG